MNKLTYLKEYYPKIWINSRENNYGILNYDKNLLKIIDQQNCNESKIMELSCGNGYPFQSYLQNRNKFTYGLDLALLALIDGKVKYNLRDLTCSDAVNLPFKSDVFNTCFSFHSSWYYDNIELFILEAIRTLKKDGLLIFDIMNSQNLFIKAYYLLYLIENKGVGKILKIMINILKITFRKIPDWKFVVYFKPSNPLKIIELCSNNNNEYKLFYRDLKEEIVRMRNLKDIKKFKRLVFIIKK